jgi:predicted amidohydrolase
MVERQQGSAEIGRPVRVVSIGFAVGKTLDEVAVLVDQEAGQGDVDLIALPETWLGQGGHAPEPLDGPTISAMAGLARKHRVYIVCPIDRLDGSRRFNSAVLLERDGRVACVYDKVYPVWPEFEVTPPVEAGGEAPVYQADFGRIGMAICFDVNFPEVWRRLADQGAELVIWPSAYPAGTSLAVPALLHHYYIVTATQARDCIVYDITGQEIHYQKSEDVNISRLTLDLDRCIFHQDYNPPKMERLLAEHPEEIELEQAMPREGWYVLRARCPGASARELARQYGLEELAAYIDRSHQAVDALRGWPFRSKV